AGCGRDGRSVLHHPPERHVQLLRPECRPDGAPAFRVRHLRRGLGPHLRGRAEQWQPQGRGGRHQSGAVRRRKSPQLECLGIGVKGASAPFWCPLAEEKGPSTAFLAGYKACERCEYFSAQTEKTIYAALQQNDISWQG